MIASPFEIDTFRQSVDDMSLRLEQGDGRCAAMGLGIIAAAVSRVDTRAQAYDLVDIRSDELGLTANETFFPGKYLHFWVTCKHFLELVQ